MAEVIVDTELCDQILRCSDDQVLLRTSRSADREYLIHFILLHLQQMTESEEYSVQANDCIFSTKCDVRLPPKSNSLKAKCIPTSSTIPMFVKVKDYQ